MKNWSEGKQDQPVLNSSRNLVHLGQGLLIVQIPSSIRGLSG